MSLFNLKSIRSRYAVMTGCVALLMVAGNWFAQLQLTQVQDNIAKNLESRNTLLQRHRHIRNAIWHVHDMITKFQVDPKHTDFPQYIHTVLEQAMNHTDRLLAHQTFEEKYRASALELRKSLADFDGSVQHLVEMRLRPESLFPSMKTANTEMQPRHMQIMHSLSLAIHEYELLDDAAVESNYRLILDLRTLWVNLIANFRMYMLNRLNSFHESSIPNQIATIETQIAAVQQSIKRAVKLSQQGQFEFQTNMLINDIANNIDHWIKAYHKVKKINLNGEWRNDTLIYRTEIEPKLDKITDLLRAIDVAIEQSGMDDITYLSAVAEQQVSSLKLLTLGGLLVLVLGFFLLERLVLKPISQITQALKDEAMGTEAVIPSKVSTYETKNLIDAFSEMRKQVYSRQNALEYHALHDGLTGLANRNLFNERVQQAIHNAAQDNGSFAVMIMDLNRFKEVNDTLGHQVGDKLLTQVGKRLQQCLRETDTVARLGGDEFAILLNSANDVQSGKIASKILHTLEEVFLVNDVQLYIGASIGIAIYPHNGMTDHALIQRADIAMYNAKRNKSGYAFYDSNEDKHSVGKLSLISDLRTAIDNNQLKIYYQPIINIHDGSVLGAEALLRWEHPVYGKIVPNEIIPLAEQTGLIRPITHWMMENAINFNQRLQKMGLELKVSVNLSVYNLQEPDIIDSVRNILAESQLPPDKLSLEITESAMMMDQKHAIEVLTSFGDMGVEIAIDDFGTGFSSLAYLKQLPVNTLKIDKSFVMDMAFDENDAVIVRSTIDLAHNLGIKVIAEGIESREILDLLRILGCDAGQGYHFSRPMNEIGFIDWVNSYSHKKKSVQAN